MHPPRQQVSTEYQNCEYSFKPRPFPSHFFSLLYMLPGPNEERGYRGNGATVPVCVNKHRENIREWNKVTGLAEG